MKISLQVVACLALGWVAGCEDVSRYEETRVQSLCVETTVAGAIEVDVALDVCLSSSCDKVVDSGCTVIEGADGVLEIEAFAVIESKGETCTADCGGASVSCTFDAPLPQTYTVQAADGDVEVEYDAVAGERVCSPDEL